MTSLPRYLLLVFTAVLMLAAGSAPPVEASSSSEVGSEIEHIVVIIEQNHTFDSYFGTYPGADGFDAVPEHQPINFRDYEASSPSTHDVSSSRLSNARSAAIEAFGAGAMDGFSDAQERRGFDGELAFLHRDRESAPVLWQMADDYVLFDRYFSSVPGASLANTLMLMTGDSQGVSADSKDSLATVRASEAPTVFERLQDKDESWRLYVGRLDELDPEAIVNGQYERSDEPTPSSLFWAPVLGMPRFWTTPELRSGLADQSDFYRDASTGELPAVSFVLPQPTDHPASSGMQGHTRLQSLTNALIKGPGWENTAVFIVWDDWGGFYDHVAPPTGFGFRVPMLLLSPQVREGHVSNVQHDHASVLNFIVNRFDLESLSARQAAASGFSDAFLPVDEQQAFDRDSDRGLILNQTLESTPVGTSRQNNATLGMYFVAGIFGCVIMAMVWRRPRPLGALPAEGVSQ